MKVKLVYEQVKERIEYDIRQRTPGELLHSEMQYARELDVSRLTVRKAVDDLVTAQLIQRIPGKGLVAMLPPGRVAPIKLLFSLPFVVDDSEYFQTLMGCIDAANRLMCEYKIIAFSNVNERLESMLHEDLSAYAGAVISCYESDADQKTLELLQARGMPIVLVGDVHKGLAHIGTDDYNGGYLTGEYLARKGHRDILYLTSDRPVPCVARRTAGFIKALTAHKIPIREDYILAVKDPGTPLLTQHAHQRELPKQINQFLDRSLPFTALTGYSTLPILSMCSQLHKHGFKIPDDISVVAYGSTPYLSEQNVMLTAVLPPTFEQGAAAVEMLLNLLSDKPNPVQSRLLPVIFQRNNSVKAINQ